MPTDEQFRANARRTFALFREVFLPKIKITSKDMLEPSPMTLYQSQEYFLKKIQDGLESGVHDFKFLKARQLGCSTAMLPLSIFWLYMNKGLQGALIADTGDNKETFRETVTQMLESIPPNWRVPIRSHNRNALVLANGSRLQYMSAGRGKNSSLGRSRAFNFVHATECSSWGDQKGLDSLRAALSTQHPNRLYVFESTALGQNLWFDMCQEAKEDPDQSFSFIGWWMKDTYRIKEGTEAFDRWWRQNPQLTEEEQEKGDFVARHYHYEIDEEQWAWYRREAYNKSEESLFQEFPSTEIEAWVTTGSNFFPGRRINDDMIYVRQLALFKGYTVDAGKTFSNLQIKQALNAPSCDLRVWEEPKAGAKYVIGMDVAFGLSEDNDSTVIEVFRCFADKLVQVAEYATPLVETQPAAWVLAWLAGCYRDCRVNLEISGPGAQVMMEIKHLKQQLDQRLVRDIPRGLNVERSLEQMRWFLWHRPDQMGTGFVYNFKTSWDNKMSMLNGFRDSYVGEQMVIRSVPLLDEMTTLKQEGDSIAASGRNKDDRVMAAGLAHYAWTEWVRNAMMQERRDYKSEMAVQNQRESSDKVIDHIIPAFLNARKAERTAAQWARALSGEG